MKDTTMISMIQSKIKDSKCKKLGINQHNNMDHACSARQLESCSTLLISDA